LGWDALKDFVLRCIIVYYVVLRFQDHCFITYAFYDFLIQIYNNVIFQIWT